jgi:hypothetical protein
MELGVREWGAVARHVCGKGEASAEFWWGNVMERDRIKDVGLGGRIVYLFFKKWDGAWIGLIWLRVRSCGEMLRIR